MENRESRRHRSGDKMVDDDQDIRLDKIYSQVDKLMWASAWDEISDLMDCETLQDQHIDAMLAYLTSSLPAKSKIPGRPAYFKAVEKELERRGRLTPGILGGLE